MTKRSQWCDVSKEVRRYVIERDKKCIWCGAKKPLTMAHIFLSRAKGGKGSKENIVALCPKCHYYTLDNPIGKENIEKSKEILEKCKKYLIEYEKIVYNDEFINHLKYHKTYDIINTTIQEKIHRCSECIYLVKKENKRNSIPVYYCNLEKKQKAKKGVICNNFKNN